MIAIFRRTPAGVVRVATVSTVAEAHDKLRGIRAPAVAFAGGDPVGATGYTSTADRDAIARHAATAEGLDDSREPCRLCPCRRARTSAKTPEHLGEFCQTHRDRIRSCRGLDATDPAAVDAYVARRMLRDGR